MARAFAKFWKDLDALGLTKDHKACALYCHFLCVASVTARSVVFNGTVIDLQPGQLVTSRSELVTLLGLTDKEVRRAIRGLENLHLVGQMKAGKYTVIYLTNSDACKVEGPDEGQIKGQMRASSGPDEGPDEGQVLYKEGERENRERETRDLSVNSAADAAPRKQSARRKAKPVLDGWRMDAFEKFWDAYAHKFGRGGAEKAWAAIPNLDAGLVERICDAARKEAARRPAWVARGMTPKMAQGWLSERRWEDDYSQPAQTPAYRGQQGQYAGMTWAEIRDEKNKQACREALQEYMEEQGIKEDGFEQQPDEVQWTVTVNE